MEPYVHGARTKVRLCYTRLCLTIPVGDEQCCVAGRGESVHVGCGASEDTLTAGGELLMAMLNEKYFDAVRYGAYERDAAGRRRRARKNTSRPVLIDCG